MPLAPDLTKRPTSGASAQRTGLASASAKGRDAMAVVVVSLTGRPRVIIVGAGFGGITAARALAGCEVDILLIDRTNHHVFQVAGSVENARFSRLGSTEPPTPQWEPERSHGVKDTDELYLNGYGNIRLSANPGSAPYPAAS
jgi:choline dehydrogenase-like flavoprotein